MTRKKAPDCVHCIHRETCPRYEAGNFCTQYQSQPTPQRDQRDDPNQKWQRGEDTEF